MLVVKTATLTEHFGKSNSSQNFSISFYKFYPNNISRWVLPKSRKTKKERKERLSPGANWLAYTFFL